MAKGKLKSLEELSENKRIDESKLVKGSNLPETLKQEVLRSYIYRWTKENERNARQAMGKNIPTIPLVSDLEWLEQHAFHVTNDGSKLDARNRHCEPAYMANEDNSPFEVDDITPEEDIQKLYGIHKDDHSAVVYYDDGSDSWKEVPTDTSKWGTDWKFGIKNNKTDEDILSSLDVSDEDVLAFYRDLLEIEKLEGLKSDKIKLNPEMDTISKFSHSGNDTTYIKKLIKDATNLMEANTAYKPGEKVSIAAWDNKTGKFDNWDDAGMGEVISDEGNEVKIKYLDDPDAGTNTISKDSVRKWGSNEEKIINEETISLIEQLLVDAGGWCMDDDNDKKAAKDAIKGVLGKAPETEEILSILDTNNSWCFDNKDDIAAFIATIKQQTSLNENADEISSFLDENGIYGYTNQINTILSNKNINDNILDDVKDFLVDNNYVDSKFNKSDILKKMSVAAILSAYLGWNGIIGYTEDLLDIAGIDYNPEDIHESNKKSSKLPLLKNN